MDESRAGGVARLIARAFHDARSAVATVDERAALLAEGLCGPISDAQLAALQAIRRSASHLALLNDAIDAAARLSTDHADHGEPGTAADLAIDLRERLAVDAGSPGPWAVAAILTPDIARLADALALRAWADAGRAATVRLTPTSDGPVRATITASGPAEAVLSEELARAIAAMADESLSSLGCEPVAGATVRVYRVPTRRGSRRAA